MEDDMSVMSRPKTTSEGEAAAPEESSWTMYFEDLFSERSKDDCRSDDDDDDDDDDDHDNSSVISDAASFVGGMKTIIVGNDEPFHSSKKRRSRQVSISAHDLEDTASSPSRSPNVCSMMNLLNNNTRHEGVGGDTNNAKGTISSGHDDVSIDLKKKGLCLVPLSLVAHYLG